MAQVTIKQAEREEIIQLSKDIVSIGRNLENDIVLWSEGVSRRHSEIRKIEEDYYIVDLGSRNGTYVNGERVKEQKLVLGDRITIGNATIIFEKEIPQPEVFRTVELSQINDFVVTAKRKHWGVILVIGIIILVVFALVMWRSISGRQELKEDKNLLGLKGAFDSPEFQGGQIPTGWLVTKGTSGRATITQEEAHSGPNSLTVEKLKPIGFYAECRYGRVINLSLPASAYSFGGWVKSEPFNRCLAGFKLGWLKPDEIIPFAETYTPAFQATDEWQERTISVIPPEDARAVLFSCVMAGANGKIYFDDLKISPVPPGVSSLEGMQLWKETTNLVLQGGPAGTWSLHTKDGSPILRCGGLTIDSKTGESFQAFSDYSSINRRGKIPFSNPIEWLDYEMDFKVSDNSLTIRYFIPFQKSTLTLAGTYVRFIMDPQIIEDKMKILSNSLKEFSYDEPIREKDVSWIDLGVNDHILSIRYPVPLDVAIVKRGNVLEFRQGWFDKPALIRYGKEGIRLTLDFGWSTRITEVDPSAYNQMLERAKQREDEKKLGRAIKIYREIVAGANKESEVWRQAYNRFQELNKTVRTRLEEINRLIKEADLITDENIYEQAAKLCQDVINDYRESEFVQQAESFQTRIREKIGALKSGSIQKKINSLMVLAEGYSREEKWTLARLFYEEIIRLGKPESEIVHKAQERLKEIEGKETVD